MKPDDMDRAEREVEELRQLFSAQGRRRGKRFNAVMRDLGSGEPEAAGAAQQAPAASSRQPQSGADARPPGPPPAAPPPLMLPARDERAGPGPRPAGGERSSPEGAASRPKVPPVKVFQRVEAEENAAPALPAPPAVSGMLEPAAVEPAPGPVGRAGDDEKGLTPPGHEVGPGVLDLVPWGLRRHRRLAMLLLLGAVLLAAVFVAGLRVGKGGVDAPVGPPAAVPAPMAPSTVPDHVPSATHPPGPAASPRACLDTARYGDQVIQLLTANVRDRRINDPMMNYTRASQACRAAAEP